MAPSGLVRRHRDFRSFWAGQTVSVVGTQVTSVALPLVAALTLHSGAGGVSVVATASYLPNLVFPLLAGHWLEYRRRRKVMMTADIARFVTLAAVPVAYALNGLSLALLAAVAFVVGTASVVFDIGSFAYIPCLVEADDLPAANRAMQGSATAAQVAGPGLSGILVQIAGPAAAIAVDSVSYLGSVLGLARIKHREPSPDPPKPGSGVFGGLIQIMKNKYLSALTAHAAIYNAASQVLNVNLIVWVVDDRHAGAGVYGLAISAAGAGAFVGTMASLKLANRIGYGKTFASSLLLSTGFPLLIALIPFHGVTLGIALGVLEFASGIGLGSANVLSVTLRQVITPGGSLARSNGGYRLLIFGSIPIGTVIAGVVGEWLGSRAGVAIGAAGLSMSALPMLTRRIRSLKTPQDAAQDVVSRT